jgi:hypothetical protein
MFLKLSSSFNSRIEKKRFPYFRRTTVIQLHNRYITLYHPLKPHVLNYRSTMKDQHTLPSLASSPVLGAEELTKRRERKDSKSPSPQSLVIVIKVGSSSIVDSKTLQIRLALLTRLVEAIIELRDQGHKVVLVSSGAVAVGMRRLKISTKPSGRAEVHAVAAAGQGRLMALYDDLFGQFDLPIAQILLTKDNLADVSFLVSLISSARNT